MWSEALRSQKPILQKQLDTLIKEAPREDTIIVQR